MLGSDEEADVDMDSSPQDAASGAHSGSAPPPAG